LSHYLNEKAKLSLLEELLFPCAMRQKGSEASAFPYLFFSVISCSIALQSPSCIYIVQLQSTIFLAFSKIITFISQQPFSLYPQYPNKIFLMP